MFQNGIVYRYIRTFREVSINLLLLVLCIEVRHHRREYLSNLGLINTECIDDSIDIPDENTCVPEIVILTDILLCSLYVRLLLERVYTENLLV